MEYELIDIIIDGKQYKAKHYNKVAYANGYINDDNLPEEINILPDKDKRGEPWFRLRKKL